MTVGALQRFVQLRAQHAHRRVLKPAALPLGPDHGDIGTVAVGKPRGEARADAARSEVLVLDVDAVLRGCDRIEIQLLDLRDDGPSFIRGLRQRDAEFDALDIRDDVGGPDVRAIVRIVCFMCFVRRRVREVERLARRALPALAHEHADGARGIAVEHRLHVVHRLIGCIVGVAAQRRIGVVRGRVPARTREVDTTRERQRVVDDDDLLMM